MPGRLEKLSAKLEARYRIGIVVVAAAVFAAGIAGITASDAENVATPRPRPPPPPATADTSVPPSPSERKGIEGFESIAFSVANGDGRRAEHCGLLAESSEQLSRGLMGQRDLGGYDAMIFRFPEAVDSSFYMANVPVPLDISWFEEDGDFVSSTTMEPCRVEASKCPLYDANGRFRFALETTANGLDELGIGEDSTLQLGGTCT